MHDNEKLLLKLYPAVIPIIVASISIILFMSGFGRYRVILAIIAFFTVKALLKYNRCDTEYLEKLYFPLLAITIYMDYKYDQLEPIIFKSNPIIAALLVVVIEIAISNSVKAKIEDISNFKIFALCPKCGYEMNQLAIQCENCAYSTNNYTSDLLSFHKKMPQLSKLNNIIDLTENETIIKHIKLDKFTAKSIYKNDKRLLLSDMIITNKRLVLIKLKSFGRGWRYKEYIEMENIKNIQFNSKYYINKNIPTMEIVTIDDCSYELYFVYFSSALSKLKELAEIIRINGKYNLLQP